MSIEVKRIILESILNPKRAFLMQMEEPHTTDCLVPFAFWFHNGKVAQARQHEVEIYFSNRLTAQQLIESSQMDEPARWAHVAAYLAILNHEYINKLERTLLKTS